MLIPIFSLLFTADGLTVLNWFISITSASFFSNWAIIAVTNLRFHQALRVQKDKLFEQTYPWRSIAWPLAPVWLLLVCLMLTVCLLYAAVTPLVSADSFILWLIPIPLALFLDAREAEEQNLGITVVNFFVLF